MTQFLFNSVAVISMLSGIWVLFHRKIRNSIIWHATVTPLASIIGSGFLVSAPILILATGRWAPLVMILVVCIAYGLGACLRFNIKNIESVLDNLVTYPWLNRIEAISRPCLGIAYIISVAFYLKLLSAFALRGSGLDSLIYEKSVTTLILLFIGVVGKLRGLKSLVFFETYAVNLKLAIILSIIVCFALYNTELLTQGTWIIKQYPNETWWMGCRKVMGMLIIIQGFETSRYIGLGYSGTIRIKTMRYAQWISGVIYIFFVALAMVVFTDIHQIHETSIIDICRIVAPILAPMLIIAAIMSQFSAAIADTLGSGGLLVEASHKSITVNNSYLLITILAIVLTWVTNIYEILTLASKAFAIYYAFQIVLTLISLEHFKPQKNYLINKVFYSFLLLLMLTIFTFGIPSG
jgi:hypothetical protein